MTSKEIKAAIESMSADELGAYGLVRGPVDADGVMWHSGDMSDTTWGVIDGIAYRNGTWFVCGHDMSAPWMEADSVRHYHKSTVDNDEAKHKACGIIDAMRFVPSSEYRFDAGREYFISGPMSGIDGWNKAAFDACEARIKELSQGGAYVLNPASDTPAEISSERPHTYYMFHTLHELVQMCYADDTPMFDAVVLLPDWEKSYGAVMEAMVAHECGIDLVLWEE